jgi:outer membrane protein assembly factor BamB
VHSTPAVAGSVVIVGSCNGMIRALDRATGHLVWEHNTGHGADSSFHGDPLLFGDLILIGTDGPSDDGIYAVARDTGTLRWTARVPTLEFDVRGVATDIQVLDGRVFATSTADEVLSFRLDDGSLLWSYRSDYRERQWLHSGTPAIADGIVYFGGLDGTAYALMAENGKPLWKQHLGDSIRTSTCVIERGVVMGTMDGRLHLLDAKTGSIKGQLKVNKEPSGPIVAIDGKLLVCTDWLHPGSELMCVDDSLSRVAWKQESPERTVWSTPRPYVYEGHVFLGNTRGGVFEYRLSDGHPVRQTHVGGVIRGIRLTDGVLYVGDQEGTVYAIKR